MGLNPFKSHSDVQLPNLSGVSDAGTGVAGMSNSGVGVWGSSTSDNGVFGTSTTAQGVVGDSDQSDGVAGRTHVASSSGVYGYNSSAGGNGVAGISDSGGNGVYGQSNNGSGVHAHSTTQFGVYADSDQDTGIYAKGPKNAGFFEGNIWVTGDVNLPEGKADFAEEFDIAETAEIEPGTVMVLNHHGALQPSQQAYDKKVAGVISGAGDYKPGLILDKKESSVGRLPIALVGKVYCKVDAQYGSIEVGDLLTSSHTPGHAMKAEDPLKAFGAVIGKALRPLHEGQALIPVLIALQ